MTRTDQRGRIMRLPRTRDNKTKANVSDAAPSVEDVRRLEAEATKRRNTASSPKGVAAIERILKGEGDTMVDRLRAAGHHEAAASLATYEEAREFFGISVGELKCDAAVIVAMTAYEAEEITFGKLLEILMVLLHQAHLERA